MKVYKSGSFGLIGRPRHAPKKDSKSPSSGRGERSEFAASKTSRKAKEGPLGRSDGRKPGVKKPRRSGRRPLATLLSVFMVLVGIGLVGYSLFGSTDALAGVVRSITNPVEVPQDTEMTLTVPKMSRVENDPVYTAPAADTATLDKGAVRVAGTGSPWDAEANVFIAGHRLGYAGSGSFLQFYDLNKLENGDEIILKDSNGTKYTYSVFNKIRVEPTETQVMEATPGKNIVSLQTCTLPDYSRRLIVQGELTSVA